MPLNFVRRIAAVGAWVGGLLMLAVAFLVTVEVILRSFFKYALAAGAEGLFIETHPDPAQAISDGPNMIPLPELPALLASCLAVWKAVR